MQVHIIGDTMELPSSLQEEIKVCEKDTANNDGLILNVAINYGGRMELVNAVRDISQKLQKAGWKQILLQKKPSRTTSILRHHQMWICLYVRAVNRGYRISFYGRFRIANCISHLFYGLIFQVKSWKRLFSGSQEEIVVWRFDGGFPMKIRVITAVVGIIAVLGLVALGGWFLTSAVFVVSVLSLFEFKIC